MNINFELTIEEANYVLGALARMPYEQVVNLMDKLRKQAQEQIDRANNQPEMVTKKLPE